MPSAFQQGFVPHTARGRVRLQQETTTELNTQSA
jgi:hypothetical protein